MPSSSRVPATHGSVPVSCSWFRSENGGFWLCQRDTALPTSSQFGTIQRQMRFRQFVAPVFVTALLGSALLTPFSLLGQWLLVSVAGSYALANLAASAWTARKGGLYHLPLLPLGFASLHLSYGLGFLLGLMKFAGRWRD
jgi:hypothetical protein